MRLRYARLRTHQQGRPAAGWCRRPIDKATPSTPSARRRRPDFRTPPRCDRLQGDPRSLPAQARRVQAGRRACDRPGAVSSRTPTRRGGGAGARPGPGWPAFGDIGAARCSGLPVGGLSSSPGRGLAGASALRFELPSWRARSGANRATRLHSHWLNQDFFGPVCPLFARKFEKPRKKSGRGGCQACHSLRILSPRRRSRKRPSRPGSPPTGRQLDN